MISTMYALLLLLQPHAMPALSTDDYAKMLEDPLRSAWQKPDQVVAQMHLKPGDTVADIGAGSGYFARRIAPLVEKVYAVDIDAKLLEIAAKQAPKNMETVLAAPDDPKLPARSVDVIFFCDVLHHIENRGAYYVKLKRALKPGGRVVVVDFYKKKNLPVGPPMEMRLSETEVTGEFRAAGFRVSKSLDFLPYQYFLVFRYRGRGLGMSGWLSVNAD
ncbi:MAG: class I SAM-dependent methyltransferase [Bryobacteraceae bacterium]